VRSGVNALHVKDDSDNHSVTWLALIFR
jgi:hypothetical protein